MMHRMSSELAAHVRWRSRRSPTLHAIATTVALIAASVLLSPAYGQAHGNRGRAAHIAPHMHTDGRFSHNHPYYDHGNRFNGYPRGGYEVHHGGQSYWYDRNHWYRRRGGVSVVIGAPIGAFVPFLPYYYSTIWWHGLPYYYANDTYYSWNGAQDEYEIVAPPATIESDGTTQAPASSEIFIYPRNGQSADQQARDRYECHRSAVDHTGYDPTLADGGVPADSVATKRSDYLRAQAACLDARGYSVK
jgi:hypothetical protein